MLIKTLKKTNLENTYVKKLLKCSECDFKENRSDFHFILV